MPLEVSKRARRSGAFFPALAWADSSHFHLDMMHLVDVSPGGGHSPRATSRCSFVRVSSAAGDEPPPYIPGPLRRGTSPRPTSLVLCGGGQAPALRPWSSAAGDKLPPYIPGPLRRGASPPPTSLVLCGGAGPPPHKAAPPRPGG